MIEHIAQAYSFLAKGGPVMIFIGICSVMALAIAIERFISLREKNVFPLAFMNAYKQFLASEKPEDLKQLSASFDVPLSRLSLFILGQDLQNYTHAKDEVELRGRIEIQKLEKNLNFLGSIATVSPLLGLLGTVTGMIKTFAAIKLVGGVGDPLELSAGISEALINTAAGLFVAIPAFMLHRFFYKKVDEHTLQLEEYSQALINRLDKREVSIQKS